MAMHMIAFQPSACATARLGKRLGVNELTKQVDLALGARRRGRRHGRRRGRRRGRRPRGRRL
eukprot:4787933-Pyramimonas_sp.AAC.1